MSVAPDDFQDWAGAGRAYGRGFTTEAEARAIKAEHERRRDMAEWLNEWRSEIDRKRKAKLTSRLVVAGLVGIFLVLAAVWGRP